MGRGEGGGGGLGGLWEAAQRFPGRTENCRLGVHAVTVNVQGQHDVQDLVFFSLPAVLGSQDHDLWIVYLGLNLRYFNERSVSHFHLVLNFEMFQQNITIVLRCASSFSESRD